MLTLNSSYTLLMLLVSAFPRMPPISTFSNFKNWGGEIFYFFSEWEMIYKQHFHAVQYNMTIWHLNCGVEKLNHRVESVQERVKAMENHLLLGWGKCEKKNSKKKDLHLKWQPFGKKSESNQQKDRFAPEIPNIWPLSLGPYNTTAVLSCTPIYSSCKISFNKIGQRGVMSV